MLSKHFQPHPAFGVVNRDETAPSRGRGCEALSPTAECRVVLKLRLGPSRTIKLPPDVSEIGLQVLGRKPPKVDITIHVNVKEELSLQHQHYIRTTLMLIRDTKPFIPDKMFAQAFEHQLKLL